MILDQIKNALRYHGLHPNIRAGLEYLAAFKSDAFALGRDDVQGDTVFALKQEYPSKPRENGVWESHRRYTDIQFIVSGEEQMGYAPVSSLATSQPYDAEKDYSLYQGEGQFFSLQPGWFAIFFPEDAHMPGIAIAAPGQVRKIVIKADLS